MKLTILKGTQEIGGSCVEISTESTRILLDMGQPLDGSRPNVPTDLDKIDAVLISHPHQDHFGLIEILPSQIPVYVGRTSEKLMQASRIFLSKEPMNNNFSYYEAWKPFVIGDLTITPYLVDHSACDAYAFLVEADGKRIFYSGDFRAHGRKSVLFENMIKRPVGNVDALLMEGTMMGGRSNQEFPDERAVETRMIDLLKAESGPAFLMASSQNIDRMVSAVRACIQSGRLFVVDIYTAWVLNEVARSVGSGSIPDFNWDVIRVLAKGGTAARHYGALCDNRDYFGSFTREIYQHGNVITEDELRAKPGLYLIKTSYVERLLDSLNQSSATIIYSQWKGYMEEQYNPSGYKRYTSLQARDGVKLEYAHTSGHATVDDLDRFVKAINPKHLIPIHTEHADKYDQFGVPTVTMTDGETVNI